MCFGRNSAKEIIRTSSTLHEITQVIASSKNKERDRGEDPNDVGKEARSCFCRNIVAFPAEDNSQHG